MSWPIASFGKPEMVKKAGVSSISSSVLSLGIALACIAVYSVTVVNRRA